MGLIILHHVNLCEHINTQKKGLVVHGFIYLIILFTLP
jgi:hypothetical protein